MKFNIFSACLGIEAAANVAILFMFGYTIVEKYNEHKLQTKKLKVLDESLKAIEEIMKKDSDSKVEE